MNKTKLLTMLSASIIASCASPPQPQPQSQSQPQPPDAPSASQSTLAPPPKGWERSNDDKFETPSPPNWKLKKTNNALEFKAPDGELGIYISTQQEADPALAVDTAWQSWTGSTPKSTERINAPADAGWDAKTIFQYNREIGRFSQAIARQKGDTTIVALVRGDIAVLQRRGAQVNEIVLGLKLIGAQELKLQGKDAHLSAEEIAQWEAFIAEQMKAFGVPGLSVGLIYEGKIVLLKGMGVKDIEQNDPVDAKTLMMIGSTTKPMTTLLMADLINDGVMTWETPVVKVLNSFKLKDPKKTAQIQVQHLVCACTGVPRRDLELFFDRRPRHAEDVISSLSDFELFTDFGETFQYSNQMVAAGGYISAAASGAKLGTLGNTYQRLMRERIFAPIGMPESTFSIDEAITRGAASPHIWDGSAYKRMDVKLERFVEPVAPAGAIWSNAAEMSRFAQTMLAQGKTPDAKTIASAQQLKRLWTPQVKLGPNTAYGLGWFLRSYHGAAVVSHGGNTFGFTSQLSLLPESNSGFVLLTNGAIPGTFRDLVEERLFELMFNQPSQAQINAPTELDRIKTSRLKFTKQLGTVDATNAKTLSGEWHNETLGRLLITLNNTSLQLTTGDFTAPLAPLIAGPFANKGYAIKSGPLKGLPLRLNTDNKEEVLLLGEGSVEYKFIRAQRPKP